MIKSKVSDIYFEFYKIYVDIRYRINGSLILVYKMDIREYVIFVLKIKLNLNMDIIEKCCF